MAKSEGEGVDDHAHKGHQVHNEGGISEKIINASLKRVNSPVAKATVLSQHH